MTVSFLSDFCRVVVAIDRRCSKSFVALMLGMHEQVLGIPVYITNILSTMSRIFETQINNDLITSLDNMIRDRF